MSALLARARSVPAPVLAAAATLAAHLVIAWAVPLPGYFRKYALAAEHYLGGELPFERLVDFSPLYFHLSVLAEHLLSAPEAVLHGLQVVAVAASAGFLFALLRRRFSRFLASVLTAVFALDRHVLVYERILEPEAFLLFFLLAFLHAFDERPDGGLTSPLWAGAFAALALATRPTFLPVFLLVPLYGWLRRDAGWWRRSLVFLVPVAVVLLALALRAAWITGDPRAPVMNPGTVFFEGNNPISRGTSAIYPPIVLELVRHAGEIPDSAHHLYRVVARADAGRELSIAEVNAYWSGKALAFVRAEPGRFGKLLLDKLTRCFHAFRWHDIPTAWQYDNRLSRVPSISFALLATLALLGALFDVRRWRRSLLLYAAGGAQVAVMLAFYVSARQRLILVPIVLYFAGVAVRRMVELRRRGVLLAVLALLITLVLWIPDDLMRDEVYRRLGHLETDSYLQEIRAATQDAPLAHHTDLAVAAMAAAPWWLDWLRPAYFPLSRGSLEERVVEALRSRPRPAFAAIPADFDLATVLIAAGHPEEARKLLEPLIEIDAVVYRGGRQPSLPSTLLGRVHASLGDPERAKMAFEQALERAPGDPFALADLAALTGDPAYRRTLELYWSRLDAQYLLGRAFLRHGRPAEALAALTFVTERLPDFREPQIYRAVALAELGRDDDAVQQYLEASRIRLEPIVAGPRVAELFRRWAAEHPGRQDALFYAAQVLHQVGELEEALALLDTLEPPPALREPIDEERRRIQEALSPG